MLRFYRRVFIDSPQSPPMRKAPCFLLWTPLTSGFLIGLFVVVFPFASEAMQMKAGHVNLHSSRSESNASPGPAYASSWLIVTGSDPYQMGCTVVGAAKSATTGPTGQVTFEDSTTGQNLGSATLPPDTITTGFVPQPPQPIFGYVGGIGDFNGDGVPDLIVTSSGSFVVILLGKGDGTFKPATSYALPASTGIAVAVADFNGDGKLDFAVLALGTPAGTSGSFNPPHGVYVLLGNGDGTFQPAQSIALGHPGGNIPGGGLAAADFNNDGKMDLAIGDSTLRILLGSGDGTFVEVPETYGLDMAQIYVGDSNKDGKLDLVASPLYVPGVAGQQPALLLGNGDGTFQTPLTFPNGVAGAEGVADFNGDGKPDLLVQTEEQSGASAQFGWAVLLGNGDGTFKAPSAVAYAAPYPLSAAIDDFNGDGIPDLALGGSYQGGIQVLAGKGDGTFTNWRSVSVSSGGGIIAADFNKDGVPDLATTDVENAFALLNTNAATATATANGVSVNIGSIGRHEFQCSYAGDVNYAPSISNTVAEDYSQVALPQFSPLVGIYPPGQQVSINDSILGAVIRYTTDGSIPTSSSTQYTGPITINQTTTYKAVAFATGYVDSAISTATFTVQTSGGTYSVAVPAISVTKGSTGTATATVSSANTYVGVVTLSCSLTSGPAGAVDLPSCSAGQTVTLTSITTSGTIGLAVKTTSPATANLARPRKGNWYSALACGDGLTFALLLLVFGRDIRERKRLIRALLVGIVTFALVAFSACGGNGTSTPVKPDPGTTSGTYTFTVAGVGSDTGKTAASTTFNVTIP